MKRGGSVSIAQDIMDQFAGTTGLTPANKSPRRYLWTDAFAVCNFLGLYLLTKDGRYRSLAVELIDQVHNVLGRHRADDPRTGWVSGLGEEEGRAHPTIGGLRIGKALNERKPDEPIDERLEWDQDGQYFHYLTKWMHALNRASTVIGDLTYNRWAMELARAACVRFVYASPYSAQKRMYWKMSIDLSYPLVASMGHHDPLDGYITYNQLQAAGERGPAQPGSLDLKTEIREMAGICKGKSWQTDDPLGLGGLLSDAYRVAQMIIHGTFGDIDLLKVLLDASLQGLKSYMRGNPLMIPAAYRLAFRELGLSIGLRAVERLQKLTELHPALFGKDRELRALLSTLGRHVPLGAEIEGFWIEEVNQASGTWTDHIDINMVMLATSLAPEGYLTI